MGGRRRYAYWVFAGIVGVSGLSVETTEKLMSEEQGAKAPPRAPGLRQTIGSVLAAAFGVQSSKNRERDFKHGSAMHFIIGGVVFTALFVLTIVVVVKLVLHNAGI